METVTSADGTEIAFERRGEGPPAVLVHGSTADRRSWNGVAPLLEEDFTLHVMDRRGRGDSGDAEDYHIEREFEDVAAVVEAVGEDVVLIGHSYGALSSLGAARLTENLRRMVLFEPPLATPESEDTPGDILERLYELVHQGEREDIIETFFVEVANSPDRLEFYREQGTMDMRIAAAPTLPREVEGTDVYVPGPMDFEDVTVPTLVLMGSETAGPMADGIRRAADLLPNSEFQVIDGVGHSAIYAAPETFVDTILPFIREA